MKFYKPLWVLKHRETGKIFPPMKFGRCWYRGLYDTFLSAKNASVKLTNTLKEIVYYNSEERLVKKHGKEILEMFGEYEPVAINNVSWEEE